MQIRVIAIDFSINCDIMYSGKILSLIKTLRRIFMKRSIPEELNKNCELCVHALKVETTGKILCTRGKSIKEVNPEKACRKFEFDILSYKPLPSKLPDFGAFSKEDFE